MWSPSCSKFTLAGVLKRKEEGANAPPSRRLGSGTAGWERQQKGFSHAHRTARLTGSCSCK